VDFALLTKRCSYCSVQYRCPDANIKFFGGWARESDVILDYIDPTDSLSNCV
jgi:hypothetical protein